MQRNENARTQTCHNKYDNNNSLIIVNNHANNRNLQNTGKNHRIMGT